MMSTTRWGCLLYFTLLIGCGHSGDSAGNSGSGAGPTIGLNPTNLAFSVTQGDANPVHTVDISNAGNGAFDWSVSSTAPWLVFSPSSGSSGDAPTAFTARANLSGLAAGTYSGTITIVGVDAVNSPQVVPVTLIIAPTATATSSAVSVGIAWDATALSAGGYYVHYGTVSPNSAGSCAYAQRIYYSLSSLASTSAPTATINNLISGTTYYFAVSATDGSLESVCSNEISRTM